MQINFNRKPSVRCSVDGRMTTMVISSVCLFSTILVSLYVYKSILLRNLTINFAGALHGNLTSDTNLRSNYFCSHPSPVFSTCMLSHSVFIAICLPRKVIFNLLLLPCDRPPWLSAPSLESNTTAAQKHSRIADWWPWHDNAVFTAATSGCRNPRIETAKLYGNTNLKMNTNMQS